jgi:tRNA dimethylallyltransferase
MEREALYTRADRRTAEMFRRGLVKEVQALLAAGYSANLPAMSSVGYKQVTAYLNGDMSLKEAQERMNFTTHRYIRQQYTWFRRDPEIQWLEATGPDLEEKALALVQAFLAAEQN